MALSFSAVYAAVATVTRFMVLEVLLEDCERDCENLDSSDNRAHNLLKCTYCQKVIFSSTGTFMNLYTQFSEYVLYVLYVLGVLP